MRKNHRSILKTPRQPESRNAVAVDRRKATPRLADNHENPRRPPAIFLFWRLSEYVNNAGPSQQPPAMESKDGS